MENNVQDIIFRDPTMDDFFYSVIKRAAIYGAGGFFIIVGVILLILNRAKLQHRLIAGPVSFVLGLLLIAAGIVTWVLKDKLVMLFV